MDLYEGSNLKFVIMNTWVKFFTIISSLILLMSLQKCKTDNIERNDVEIVPDIIQTKENVNNIKMYLSCIYVEKLIL